MFPDRASAAAGEVDALYEFLLMVGVVMTVVIFFFVGFFAFKYRRRSELTAPRQSTAPFLEIAWSVIPFLVMLVMFAWGTKLYFQNYTPPRKDTLDIYVVGKQWMWKVQHPGGQREIDELHVPTGRAVKLTLASEDVLHSFYIPAFRLKHDVVPGSYQTYWFEATKPGRYHIFCAEYCGTNHSEMQGWVTVMSPMEYQEWLGTNAPTESMTDQGQKLFAKYGCVTCHVTDQSGPPLNNVFGHPLQLEDGRTVIADEAFLRQSILDPNAKLVKGYQRNVMPVYQGQINEDDLLQLVVYIKGLASNPAPDSTPRQSITPAKPVQKQ